VGTVLRRVIPILMILLVAGVARGQEGDTATSLPIAYGDQVMGTISSESFFDHWQLNASANDRIAVTMTGADGLAPLVGILTAGGTLLARSDDGEVNGSVGLDFTLPEATMYIIVATRVDNEAGSTTGSYTLSVEKLNVEPTRDPLYQDVVFQCGEFEATALASIQWAHDADDNGAYTIRVYGLDGLQPVLHIESGETDVCVTDPADALGDVVTLPRERPVTITEADLATTVQHVITSENPASIWLTIGSANGLPGHYLAVISGFSIEPSTDADEFSLRLAPYPAQDELPLLVYAVGVNNRLDPGMITETVECDDAGRRGCEDVSPITNAGVILNNGVRVVGDRFDAGIRIDDALQHRAQLLSFSGTTRGEYALILIGELASRE
jgi:hypothetical protein